MGGKRREWGGTERRRERVCVCLVHSGPGAWLSVDPLLRSLAAEHRDKDRSNIAHTQCPTALNLPHTLTHMQTHTHTRTHTCTAFFKAQSCFSTSRRGCRQILMKDYKTSTPTAQDTCDRKEHTWATKFDRQEVISGRTATICRRKNTNRSQPQTKTDTETLACTHTHTHTHAHTLVGHKVLYFNVDKQSQTLVFLIP